MGFLVDTVAIGEDTLTFVDRVSREWRAFQSRSYSHSLNADVDCAACCAGAGSRRWRLGLSQNAEQEESPKGRDSFRG
jgi:hypothetical protein